MSRSRISITQSHGLFCCSSPCLDILFTLTIANKLLRSLNRRMIASDMTGAERCEGVVRKDDKIYYFLRHI